MRPVGAAPPVGAAQLRSLVYEESEIRFVGGASHMCGGTVDNALEEATRAAAVSRALGQAAAYEAADASADAGMIDWAAAEAREGGSEAAPLGEESGE